MKTFRYQFLTPIIVILITLPILGVVNGPPILPSSFYGIVMVDGAYVSDGTTISAWIDGSKYAEVGSFTFETKSVYILDVTADNPDSAEKDGGEEGDTVVFKIGSTTADQTGTWHSGTNVELNLTASTIPPVPSADFSGTPTSGEAPLTVDFSDSSSGSISSWSWSFGDGGSSTATNPSHEYTTPGTYIVALTVTGPGGSDTETKVDYISVSEPAPFANFSGSPTTGTAPLHVDFTDLSSGNISSWNWEFGDGEVSTAANPSHNYTTPGSYTVSLTASSPGGSDTMARDNYITIYEEIVANFSSTPTSGAAPLNVSFTDLSTGDINSWSWAFGDGGSSSLANPSHQYSSPGVYTISLTVAGPAGTDAETKVDFIEVAEPRSLVADFTGTPRSGAAPLTVFFSELSSGEVTAWSWTFGDGGSSNEPNPTHEYVSPGTFNVSLMVSNSEGFDIEEKLDYITVSEISPESYIVYLAIIE